MMNSAFEAVGLEALYEALNVRPDQLGSTLADFRTRRVRGFNVTAPLKTTVVPLVDSVHTPASSIGAVNTVKLEGDRWIGYNTDVDGISGPLKSLGHSRIRDAVALGTGGAARAFCAAMNELECGRLVFLSRRPRQTAEFISGMRSACPKMQIDVAPVEKPPSWRPELFFNASPAGSNGVPLPERVAEVLEGRPTVFEAVYFPVMTDLLKLAEKLRCRVIRGHEMLLRQGTAAFSIWTAMKPPQDVMEAALLSALGVEPS